MSSFTLRIKRLGLPVVAAFACFLATFLSTPVQATHLMGGEITYVYLGNNGPATAPFRYRVKFVAYIDGTRGVPGLPNSSFPNGNLGSNQPWLSFYDKGTNQKVAQIALNNSPQQQNAGITQITIPVPVSCTTDDTISLYTFWRNEQTVEVNLPFALNGYYVYFGSRARSQLIKNINDPNNTGSTIFAEMASPLYANSSPQFADDATTFICQSDTATIANNARDPDAGDRLIYNLVTPLDYSNNLFMQPQPPTTFPTEVLTPITWANGYSLAQPLGAGGIATIDPTTGLARYHSPRPGTYAMAYEILEFRTLSSGQEVLIGRTRREVQIVFRECLPNNPPIGNGGNPNVPPTTNYTITEGESITFTVGATDTDTMTISASGDVFTQYPGNLATFPTVTAPGSVQSTFTWQTACGIRGTFPVNVTVQDKGCPPKVTNVIYNVNVLPFKAPQSIAGPDSACGTGQTYNYSVTSTAPEAQFRWRVKHGTILSSGTGKTITVQWDPAGSSIANDSITVIQTSGSGCHDSTTKVVKVFPVPQVQVAPNLTLCQGDTAQLDATGGSGNFHWTAIDRTPALFLTDSAVANPRAFPMDTIQYVVSSKNVLGCPSRDTIQVNVVPDVANAGPDSAICSGGSIVIGTDSVSGYSYTWTPSSLLTSGTLPRPVFSTTATGTAVDYVLAVTATHRGSACASTDSVTVRVNVLPMVNAGPDTTIVCSRGTIQLGGAFDTTAAYQWSPDSLLSAGTSPNPIFTNITNDTLVHIIKYVVTATAAETRCENRDSTIVRVDPLPYIPLAVQDSVCSGSDLVIGVPARGYSYTWTSGDSLSSTNSAQATFHYTLPVGATAPIFVTKVLHAVNPVTGCMDSSVINIKVNPLPIVNAGIDHAVCSGDTVQIGVENSAQYAYTWNPRLYLVDTALGVQIITPYYRPNPATGLGDTTINYVLGAVDRITGCRNSDGVAIRVKELPVVHALASGDTATTCSRAAIQLGTADNTDLTYTWTGAANISNPDSAITQVYLVNADNFVPRIEPYILSATSATTQCHNADTIQVRVNPQPLVETGTLDSLCSGQQIQIGAPSRPGYVYVWTPAAGLSDTASSQPTLTLINGDTLPASGTYTLLVTNQYACRDTGTLNIRTNPLPPVPLGTPPSVCSKQSFTIGAAPISTLGYTWSPLTGLTSFGRGTATGLIDNPTQHDSVRYYHLTTEVLQTHCRNSDSIAVTIRPLPIAQAGPDSVALCSGDTIQLGTGSTVGYGYTWTPATDLSSDTVSNPLASIVSAPGEIRQYRVTVLNRLNLCSNADSIQVRVNPLPQANAGIDKQVCVNDSVQIGTGGQTGFAYQWNPTSNLTDANSAQTYFHATAEDTLTYTVQVTNASTLCKNQDDVLVIVHPLPTPNAGIDRQFCSAATTQIGVDAEAGQAYSWTPTGGLNDPTLSNPVYTSVNGTQVPRTDTLTLEATITATGCKATDAVFVTVNPRPIEAIFAPHENVICPGTLGEPYSISNPQSGYTYSWSVTPTGSLASGDGTPSITINYGGPQNGVVISVLATNEYGCVQLRHDSTLVTVNQILEPATPAATSGLSQICLNQGRDTYVSNPNSPNSQYTWKYILNNGDTTTVTGVGNQIALTWAMAGTGEIWIEEVASPPGGSCFGRSESFFVRIYPSPDTTLSMQLTPVVCQNSPSSFELSGLDSSLYHWNIVSPDGTVFADYPTGPDSIAALFGNPGRYTISVMETSVHGCPGKLIDSAFMVSPKPSTVLSQADYSVCPQRPQQTFSIASPDAGATYTWVVGGGSVTAGGTGPNVEVTWVADADKSVKVVETSGDGCPSDTATATIHEDRSSLVLNYVTVNEDDDSKVDLFFDLVNPTNAPGGFQVWRAADQSTDFTGLAAISGIVSTAEDQGPNTDPTQHQYSYYVSTTNLCGIELKTDVHKTVFLTATADEPSDLSRLSWTAYEGWTDGIANYEVLRKKDSEADFSPLQPDPTVAADQTGANYKNAGDGFNQCYRMVAVAKGTGFRSFSNRSCIDFKNATVTYNIVTPNGDGQNDYVYIKNATLYPNTALHVYNRWGKLVAEKNGYRNDWSPTDLAPGTYTYIVTGTDKTIKGWFEVVPK